MMAGQEYLLLEDAALLAQCELETYKASGPGGQHRNKVSSAIRLHHRPTGITAICNDSRNQHENKRVALARLRGKIACQVRRPVTGQPLVLPEMVQSCLFVPRGGGAGKGRLQVGRKDHRFWIVVQFLLDVLEAGGGQLSTAASQLGISTSNFVTVLQEEKDSYVAAAEIRKRFGLGPIK